VKARSAGHWHRRRIATCFDVGGEPVRQGTFANRCSLQVDGVRNAAKLHSDPTVGIEDHVAGARVAVLRLSNRTAFTKRTLSTLM
jgi:hypothetical protein